MSEEDYIALIYKSVKGEISSAEKAVLETHTHLSEENAILRADIEDSWLFSQDNSAILEEIDVEQDLLTIKKNLDLESTTHSLTPSGPTTQTIHSQPQRDPKVRRFNMRRLAIAALFLMLAVAGHLITGIGDTHQESIYASKDEILKVDLADGSVVTLNKNSYLHVPRYFSETHRKVELEGEAFFGVEASQAHPFEITTGKSIVTVLGTSFNVRTSQENCVVGVTSGKVKLEDINQTNQIILKKDEVGRHTYGDDRIIKHSVTASNLNYWQKENIVFRNTSLSRVIDQLSLMYGINIQLENDDISECKVSLVSNDITIDKVVSKVSLSLEAQVETNDNKNFVIKNGTCK